MTTASACGKAILLGEHAVVYGQPAIAIPLTNLLAFAEVTPGSVGMGIVVEANDLGQTVTYPGDDNGDLTALALQTTIHNLMELLHCDSVPALHINLHSQLPTARGLGSGTAITTALVRAIMRHLGYQLPPSAVSDLVYRTEIVFHGQPSGIDNTVVAHEQAVLFQRGQPLQLLSIDKPFRLLVADTGIAAQTRTAVGEVRHSWQSDQARYEVVFARIGSLVALGRTALTQGDWSELGHILDANHALLCDLGVSCPELDRLVLAACGAGALGAKLSGGGLGGCMIALVDDNRVEVITKALADAGAIKVWNVEVCDAHRD
ncbi:MAG: mevalonate kinase [Anaerolineae bacterium]